MKWSILIPTVGQRKDRFVGLIKTLTPQIKDRDIEIVAYWNNGELPLGNIRQALVDEAKGEYISFIDDDDAVPTYYCAEILDNLDGVDYVGWKMQLYHNGEKMKPTYHSLKYTNWHEDDMGYYRDTSHLNPIKRELALKESFITDPGSPEDADWAKRIRQHVKSENYIDRVMYHYHHSTEDSIWRGDIEIGHYIRPQIKNKQFRWHPASKKEYDGNSAS